MADAPRPTLKADPRALAAIARFEARGSGKADAAAAKPDERNVDQAFQLRADPRSDAAAPQTRFTWQVGLAAVPATLGFVLLALHPLAPLVLLLALGVAGVLWFRPQLAIALLPVCVGLLDLAPWSGWWFFDELDGLLLVMLAVLLVRAPLARADLRFGPMLATALVLLAVSYAVATVLALTPWPAVTPNSFTSYDSPFNSLRIGKGFWFIALFMPWLQQAANRGRPVLTWLATGFLASLLLAGLYVVAERWLMVGLLNLNSFYRSVGPFYSMNTGDGHIDVWFAALTPFVLACLFLQPRRWFLPLGGLCAPVALYAVVTTGSRGPFVAIFVGLALGAAALLLRRGTSPKLALAGAALAVLAAVATPPLVRSVLQNSYLGKRFETLAQDTAVRQAHWRQSLAVRADGAIGRVFGSGLGSFPARWAADTNAKGQPQGDYEFRAEGAERYLQLTPGVPVYVQQLVAVRDHQSYALKFRMRAMPVAGTRIAIGNAQLEVSLCQKWILILTHTVSCVPNAATLSVAPGTWQNFSLTMRSDDLGSPNWRFGYAAAQPVWLTLKPNTPGMALDLDDFSLRDPTGRDLLRNGDFSHGQDFWFWVSYEHMSYHTKNIVVNILFDLGWFGLAALGLTLGATLIRLALRWRAGEAIAGVWIGGLAGLITVCISVSLLDAPRLAMLFYLLLLAPLVTPRRA